MKEFLAHELVEIANEIEEIEKNEGSEKTAAEREAGLFDIFKTKMSESAAGNVESCLKGLQSNIQQTFSTWLVGDMSYIKKQLAPLRKTQAESRDGKGLANFYKTFAEWFMTAYKELDPGVKNFFKSKRSTEVLDLMKKWANQPQESPKKQISEKLKKLMDDLKKQIDAMIKQTKDLGIGLNLQNDDDIATLNKLLGPDNFSDAAKAATPQVTEEPAEQPASE